MDVIVFFERVWVLSGCLVLCFLLLLRSYFFLFLCVFCMSGFYFLFGFMCFRCLVFLLRSCFFLFFVFFVCVWVLIFCLVLCFFVEFFFLVFVGFLCLGFNFFVWFCVF